MKTKVVVIDPDRGARVLVNPAKVELFKGAKNAFINPDLSRVIKFPMYQWTVKDGVLAIADKEEIKRREQMMGYEWDNTSNLVVQKDTTVEVPEVEPEIYEVEQAINPDLMMEALLEAMKSKIVKVEVEKERIVEVAKPMLVEKQVVVKVPEERIVTREIPIADVNTHRSLDAIKAQLEDLKKHVLSLEQSPDKAIPHVHELDVKLSKFMKYSAIVAAIQALAGLIIIAFIK